MRCQKKTPLVACAAASPGVSRSTDPERPFTLRVAMRACPARLPVHVRATPAVGATAVGTYVYNPVAGLRHAYPLYCAMPTTAESTGSMLTVIAAAVEEHTSPNAYGTRTRMSLPSVLSESTPN